MKKLWLLAAAAILGTALLLSGCGTTSNAPKADLSGMGTVQAISREKGSGTRAEFEHLIGAGDIVAKNQATSTEEAISKVQSDANAIAYVAYSAVKNPVKGVKVLAVENVAPSDDAISAGKYSLTRTYYLCWVGDPSPLAADFLTYIKGAGQGVVAGFAQPLSTPTSFLSDKSAGTLSLNGSTSMAPMMTALIEKYHVQNPNGAITLTVTDSTKGLTAAMRREADMGMSSRELKDFEEEIVQKQAVARDGIAIIVNEKNPLTTLTREQINGLFSGKWEKWSDMK